MTLILSCVTNGYIIQVSDRRLTSAINYRLSSDENKAVVWCKQIVFSYTGLAQMIRPKDDEQKRQANFVATYMWLADVLVNAQIENYSEMFNIIAEQATVAFNHPANSRFRNAFHEFVAAGWGMNQESKIQPFLTRIYNEESEPDHYTFRVASKAIQRDEMPIILSTGYSVAEKTLLKTKELVEEKLSQKAQPHDTAKVLVRSIREVAAITPLVGEDLQVITLPKQMAERHLKGIFKESDRFFIHDSPSTENATFYYVPANSEEEIELGPTYVCGSAMLHDFQSTDSSVSVRIRLSASEARRLKAQKQITVDDIPEEKRLNTFILSIWKGTATFNDTYRSAIGDDYQLVEMSMQSNHESWKQGRASPYIGHIVSITAEDSVINEIHNDPRYVVLVSGNYPLDAIPTSDWYKNLSSWLSANDMRESNINYFIDTIRLLTRREILERIKELVERRK